MQYVLGMEGTKMGDPTQMMIAKLAREWWRNNGRKGEAQLYGYVDHYAKTYATAPEPIYAMARGLIQDWEWQESAR